MGLLDGGLAGFFSSALSGIYLDASLYRGTLTHDSKGGGSAGFAAAEAVKAQLDKMVERTIDGNTDMFQRIFVLADGVDEITTEDEITVKGVRWAIASVERDPAGAYYDLAGRKSGLDAGS